MTTEAPALRQPGPPWTGSGRLTPWWPLLAGLLVLAVPTVIGLGRQTWSTEAGAHGPIVISTALWLLYHDGMTLRNARATAAWPLVAAALVPAFAIYAFGRAFDFISLEAAGLYAVFVAICLRLFGIDALRRHAFPLFYLAFAIPPPGWLIERLTAPLQTFVSYAAAGLVDAAGYPVAHQGVSLFVAQYQLLVEDACAGMNSLIGLIAISLFYIYLLHRSSWRYALALTALIVPVAIAVNVVRVVALILITYYFGDEAAQGFLHVTTGIVLFGLALLFIFGIDKGFQQVMAWRGRAA